ncbi:MAG: DUF2254 domain-containing protein [Ginsengibacter sp.]
MKTHLRKLWDSLKSSYWFIPLVMMVLAVMLWWGTSTLDHILSIRDKKAIAWLYLSDAETIRTFLLTIAVAIIGVVGVVFTIIMVPLSIAASQFGPRLLRTFLRDTGTQITLGTFNATFIFCMVVLLHLSTAIKQPLPQISVNVALLLAFTSFGVLIYFINHIAVSLQAPIVVARVSKELHTAINHDFPDDISTAYMFSSADHDNKMLPDVSSAHSIIIAKVSGYLQVRDDTSLLHLAREHNLVFKLLSEPGDFIVQRTALVLTWPEINIEKISDAVNRAFIQGSQRTLVQDVTFGINELVEVAIRALSPAINDPFTAMTCLDWIGSALCQICSRTLPPAKLFDQAGHLRIIRNPVTFTKLADAAFNQIREYGRTSRYVSVRLIDTIKVVAGCAKTDEHRKILLHHATLVERNSHNGLPDANDRQVITNSYNVLKEILSS